MKKKSFFFFFVLSVSCFVYSQSIVDTLNLADYPHKVSLPSKINETSGLQYHNNYLYTFNDSGGKPEVYVLNPETGEIIKTYKLINASNIDWEDIAIDGNTLYLGDFGNNNGSRKNQKIYYFELNENNHSKKEEVEAKAISFKFEDQTDFEYREKHSTPFDCEAMVFYQENLHIFTKDWKNNQTSHYLIRLKNKDTTRIAEKIESFDSQGLITGADIYNNELYFIGYTRNGYSFMWKSTSFKDGKFFNGKAQKTFLGLVPAISQTEGITVSQDKIYICGEEFKKGMFYISPMLYTIDKANKKVYFQ